jgi:ribose transport system ATP-binding protein
VTVLRDGQVVGGGLVTADLDEEELGRLLVGRRASSSGPPAAAPRPVAARTEVPVMRVTGLIGRDLRGVSFEVGTGEVLGATGLIGSGFDELPALVTGASQAADGALQVGSETIDLRRRSLHRCLQAGVVLVPERRDVHGLALSRSVRDNLCLPQVRHRNRPWLARAAWEHDLAARSVVQLDIRPAEPDRPVGLLSGGNRQKVLFGKWLATGPNVLVLHEPTQGVDVGARMDLLHLVRQAASAGVAVIVASLETEDLAAVCDRVLIFREGKVAAELRAPFDSDGIVRLTYPPTSSVRNGVIGEATA